VDGASERDYRDYVMARRPALIHEAYLLVGEIHLAEDLVQTALTKTYVAWRRVAASQASDAYVRRILINTNTSRHRKRRVAEVLTETPPDSTPVPERQPESAAIIQALMELPQRQRAAIVLRYWDDLPESAVAELMGCSVGTVRTHTARAVARLRAHTGLRQMHEGDVATVDERDERWIRSLMAEGTDTIVVGGARLEELVADGRARLARRQILASAALIAVRQAMPSGRGDRPTVPIGTRQ
jgi:RNA polymerase sigma-70 factor (sigma-E family)